MKKIIYMIFLLTGIIATMTACSSPIKTENSNLTEEVSRVTQENQQLKEEIQQLQQNNQELDEEIARLDPSRAGNDSESVDKDGESVFNIYGANIDTYEKELISQITIKDDLTLEEKLGLLANSLSKEEFEELGIEVSKVKDENGKKIATINLRENPNTKDASWGTGYFQGSTGGTITTVSLQETFLQREYDGEWIDGVEFLYNGEKIVTDGTAVSNNGGDFGFDHVESLGEIIYR